MLEKMPEQVEPSPQNSVAPQNIAFFSDGNVLRDVGKIEGQLRGLEKDVVRLEKKVDDIASEVSKLNQLRDKIIGGVVAVSAIISGAVAIIMKVFDLL